MKPAITTNIDDIWTGYLPEPLRADKWHIEHIGPDIDDVRLYFEDANGVFVQVDLVGETGRGNMKSSEFAEDLYATTGYRPPIV